ncbi:MAG: protein phosphatase [Richelia sp. CSU_2_1]|nr:protein phosphatase [Microcoleus sp. SU_5_6]NJR26262.1 protein phosphatase [Richelia sp. CSU_2_1]
MYKFTAASDRELIVFGARRPGYSDRAVSEWIDFMKQQKIDRICCLLPQSQLNRYSDLLGNYRKIFGVDRICWAPLLDFELADSEILIDRILPFLIEANNAGDRVVVHCSGGIGRTGQVLAAWLVSGRGFSNQNAIAAVKKTGRNPYEAAIAAVFKGRNPWKVVREFHVLLDDCRRAFAK